MEGKTMQEIADILNVSKQTVFRYVNEHNIEPITRNVRPFKYKESDVKVIISGIGIRGGYEEESSLEEENKLLKQEIEALKREITRITEENKERKMREQRLYEEKDELITLLDQQQKLSLADKQSLQELKQQVALIEEQKEEEESKGFFSKWFK